MADIVTGEDEPRIKRPQRNPKLSAALLAHSEQAVLPSQQKAINTFRAAEAAKRAAETLKSHAPTSSATSSRATSPDDVPLTQPIPSTSHISNKGKRACVEDADDEDSDNEGWENARMNPKPKGV